MNRTSASLKLIPAVLWTAFIVYGLSTEPNAVPRFPWLAKPGVDKLIHLILFAVEAVLVRYAFASLGTRKVTYLVLIWALVLGGGLEIIQHYCINGRSGQVMDLVADMAGAVLGLTLAAHFFKK